MLRTFRRTYRLAALVVPAVLVVAGQAGAQGQEPLRVDLGVTQSANAAGRVVVSHWMETNVAGPKTHVTVYRQPGNVSCREDVRNPWPAGAEQLLFSVDQRTRSIWDPVVRTVEQKTGMWTVCGYVVNDDNPRFDMPYVITATRITYAVIPKNTRPVQTSWSLCGSVRAGRAANLRINGRATPSACRRARGVTTAWTSQWNHGAARNNWGYGWQSPSGRHLPARNAPRVRYARLKMPSGASYVCREQTTAATRSTPLVTECGPYRWRFSV